MKLQLPAIAMALALTACVAPITQKTQVPLTDAQTASIRSTVSYRLKDPSSAQFRDLRMFSRTHNDGTTSNFTCGQVNAKNSFGGYVGFTTFIGEMEGDKFRFTGGNSPQNEWYYHTLCLNGGTITN